MLAQARVVQATRALLTAWFFWQARKSQLRMGSTQTGRTPPSRSRLRNLARRGAIAMVNVVQPRLEILERRASSCQCFRVRRRQDHNTNFHGPGRVVMALFTRHRSVARSLRQWHAGRRAVAGGALLQECLELLETGPLSETWIPPRMPDDAGLHRPPDVLKAGVALLCGAAASSMHARPSPAHCKGRLRNALVANGNPRKANLGDPNLTGTKVAGRERG